MLFINISVTLCVMRDLDMIIKANVKLSNVTLVNDDENDIVHPKVTSLFKIAHVAIAHLVYYTNNKVKL